MLHISLKFVGLLAGIIYFQTEISQAGILNVSGAIFFLLTSVTFNNISSVIFVSNNANRFKIKIVVKIVIPYKRRQIVRELISHTGLILKVLFLKLFLDQYYSFVDHFNID